MLIYLLVWCYFHAKTFKTPTIKWREVSFKKINKNNRQCIYQQYLCESEDRHLECLILIFIHFNWVMKFEWIWFGLFRTWTLNHLQKYCSSICNMTVPCGLMLVITNPQSCHVPSDTLWVQSFSLGQVPADHIACGATFIFCIY